MSSTFGTVAEIIASLTDVPLEEIKPDSHVVTDLEIDSLDFLDAIFQIDKTFGIQVPYEKWMEDINQGNAQSDDYFVLKNLCAEIDRFVAANAA